jgi:hypothetical protein
MPNVKISQLPAVTVPLAGTEELPVVQGGVTKRTAINNILNANTIPYIANGLGAVATPSYTFTGDLNTGMWSPAADNIAFSVGGTEAMRIADTGYVGIGTNDPFTNLDMASGFANFAGTVVTDRAVKIGANRVISTDVSLDFHSAGNPSVFNAQFIRYSGVNGNFDLINSGTGNITISADGSERMRVTSAGNVGIGTSSPGAKLDVFGTSLTRTNTAAGDSPLVVRNDNAANNTTKSTGLLLQGTDTTGVGKNAGLVQCGPLDVNYVTTYLSFFTRTADVLAEKMRIDNNGNVGIGTSSPGAKLDVVGGNVRIGNNQTLSFRNAAGSATASLLLQSDDNFVASNAASTPIFSFTQAASPIAIYGANSTNRMTFDAGSNVVFWAINGSERMRIDSTGSVGIGTSSPDASALLDVSSTTKGFLPPRMSTAQRDAIGGATQEGLIIYNVTTDKLQVFAAGAWVNLH